MSVSLFVQYIMLVVYGAIFLRVLADAVYQPRRTTTNIAVFFGLPCVVLITTLLTMVGIVPNHPIVSAINRALLLSSCYMLLRLVSDFAEVPPRLLGIGAVGLVILSTGSFLWLSPRPPWLIWLQLSFCLGLKLYAARAFWRAAIPVPFHRPG